VQVADFVVVVVPLFGPDLFLRNRSVPNKGTTTATKSVTHTETGQYHIKEQLQQNQ
jgi:hypothetical protein